MIRIRCDDDGSVLHGVSQAPLQTGQDEQEEEEQEYGLRILVLVHTSVLFVINPFFYLFL